MANGKHCPPPNLSLIHISRFGLPGLGALPLLLFSLGFYFLTEPNGNRVRVGICLGRALRDALGDRAGIRRAASAYMPMDEALAFAALDLSGRPYLVFDAEFAAPMCGQFDTQLAEEFFRAFAVNAG